MRGFFRRILSPRYHAIKLLQLYMFGLPKRKRKNVISYPAAFATPYIPKRIEPPAPKTKILKYPELKIYKKKYKRPAGVARSGGVRGGAKRWK